jgi:hypothetical protein
VRNLRAPYRHRPRSPAPEGIVSPVGLILLPILCGPYGGDLLVSHGEWTPLREIGAWLNARAARKTLRLLHAVAFWAAEPDGFE